MHHMYGSWNSSWDWLWISLMTVLWVIALGTVVYVAVRMALHHEHNGHDAPPSPH